MRDKTMANEPESQTYRFWRNEVTSMIRTAKQNYFREAIASNKGNSKAIWGILRNVQSNNTGMVSKDTPNIKKNNGTDLTL